VGAFFGVGEHTLVVLYRGAVRRTRFFGRRSSAFLETLAEATLQINSRLRLGPTFELCQQRDVSTAVIIEKKEGNLKRTE